MELIVAKNQNNVIGDKGKLLWHVPGDLKYFREITDNQIVVMGRKTYDSLPNGPLPNRINVVLTRDTEKYKIQKTNELYFTSLEDSEAVLSNLVADTNKRVIIIGGVDIYNNFMNKCKVFHVTQIYDWSDGDTVFDIDDVTQKLDCSYSSRHFCNKNDFNYRISRYVRN
jgi:dihydrofolate reductase